MLFIYRMQNVLHLVSIACIVGILGDALLQFSNAYLPFGGNTSWGLKPYFKQHGSRESLFIAGGMLALFYLIYIYVFHLCLHIPITYTNIAIYSILLDLFFRETMFFQSLKEYYQYFNYFWSAVWAVIPMCAPLMLYKWL